MIHCLLTILTNSIATVVMRDANGLPFGPIISEDIGANSEGSNAPFVYGHCTHNRPSERTIRSS